MCYYHYSFILMTGGIDMSLYDECRKFDKSEYALPPIPNEEIHSDPVALQKKNFSPNDPTSASYSATYYISDLHLPEHIKKEFPNGATDKQISNYIQKIVNGLFVGDFYDNIINGHIFSRRMVVLFGGDISYSFAISKIFYKCFSDKWDRVCKKSENSSEKILYAILGNHELWEFDSFEDCCMAYSDLFQQVGITFLNNTIAWFDTQVPFEPSNSINNRTHQRSRLYKPTYALIVGGTGFAGCNKGFNANHGLYRGAIDRTNELMQTQKWVDTYKQALSMAEKHSCALIVLTHFPTKDWLPDNTLHSNCIYFYGHTHQNYMACDPYDSTIHVYADNQIGYKGKHFEFKKRLLFHKFNPFANCPDGYHEISSSDYVQFYDYMNERINGNKPVEKQVSKGAHFYMVKHNGYYGFFLTTETDTQICVGGRLKKILPGPDILWVNDNFMRMVNTYIKMLSPFRKMQEQFSEAVKQIGGDGTIHGCIVDIDFFNHIMLNPINGTVSYYYSPAYGIVQEYGSLPALLREHNPQLEKKYKKLTPSNQSIAIFPQTTSLIAEGILQEIDLKDSIYTFSNRIEQLQRLFRSKILRDWDDDLFLDSWSIADGNSSL